MNHSEPTPCPRCLAGKEQIRMEHCAEKNGVLLWSIFHCNRCAFTWRTTEPARSIDPAQRLKWAQMVSTDPADYRVNIPPAK